MVFLSFTKILVTFYYFSFNAKSLNETLFCIADKDLAKLN